jgi:hypothetical protein
MNIVELVSLNNEFMKFLGKWMELVHPFIILYLS